MGINNLDDEDNNGDSTPALTPRTQQLLAIINSRDPARITQLRGVGRRKAETIVAGVAAVVGGVEGGAEGGQRHDGGDEGCGEGQRRADLVSLAQLARVRGVGARTVQNMREGLGDGGGLVLDLDGDGDGDA